MNRRQINAEKSVGHVNNKDRKRLNSKQSIQFLLRLIVNAKGVLWTVFLISCVIVGLNLGSVFVYQILVDNIVTNQTYSDSVPLILFFIYLGVVGFSIFSNFLMIKISTKIFYKLARNIFAKMLRMSVRYYDTKQSGQIISHLDSDAWTVTESLSQVLSQFLTSILMLLSMLIAMFLTSTYLTLIILVIIIFSFSVLIALAKKSSKYYALRQETNGKLYALVEEMITGYDVIRVYHQEKNFKAQFEKLSQEYKKISVKANYFGVSIFLFFLMISNFLTIATLSFGFVFGLNKINLIGIYDGNLDHYRNLITTAKTQQEIVVANAKYYGQYISIILVFLTMVRNFNQPLNMLSQQFNLIQSSFGAIGRLDEMLQSEEEFKFNEMINMQIVDNEVKNQLPIPQTPVILKQVLDDYKKLPYYKNNYLKPPFINSLPFKKVNANIDIDNVNFGYTKDVQILKDICFKVKKGQVVAIVGPTGSGKSTFINLLTMFYSLHNGDIKFDDLSIKKITRQSMRNNISIVMQQSYLFNDTIMNNIRLSKLNATDEEVIEAAKLAECHNFIMTLKDGYNTVLENNGDFLSVGQKQLLSIAQAILSPSEILILDEATSSVDSTTELEIQKAMLKLMNKKTSFVIAHRLSTIKNSDQIIILKDGKIIETGNHQSLIQKQGFYYELYNSQFE